MEKYDAIVLGAGPGGYECAIKLSLNGLKTALVEEDKLGGTCLNRGCIPTKSFLHSAEVYKSAKNASQFGINIDLIDFDYEKIVERKDIVVSKLVSGIGFLEQSHGVDVFYARGRLQTPKKIILSDGREIEADNIVLATGSAPAVIPIPGVDLPGVLDSTGILDLKKKPEKVVIIGGGVIGVEFATFFSEMGVNVSIIEMFDRILMPVDAEVSKLITRKLKAKGVEIYTGACVDSITEGLSVNFTVVKNDDKKSVDGDIVLMAGGRKANSKGMGFEEAGIEIDKRGFVVVDDFCRTNIESVYAIGDLNGKMQLAHVASAQAAQVADMIAGKKVSPVNLNQIPSCVYSVPEIAMIGLTEDTARQTGKNVGIGIFNLVGNGKSMVAGENEGFVKFVFDIDTDEILGCHIIGPRATDMIAEVSAVMSMGGKISDIANAVHPHPTVSESIMEAAHACHKQSINSPRVQREEFK